MLMAWISAMRCLNLVAAKVLSRVMSCPFWSALANGEISLNHA
jgi:hypothetical protein